MVISLFLFDDSIASATEGQTEEEQVPGVLLFAGHRGISWEALDTGDVRTALFLMFSAKAITSVFDF